MLEMFIQYNCRSPQLERQAFSYLQAHFKGSLSNCTNVFLVKVQWKSRRCYIEVSRSPAE